MKNSKKLFIVLEINPVVYPVISFSDNPYLPEVYTRGEGQAMIFELFDADFTEKFGKTVSSGKFLKSMKGKKFKINLFNE